MIKHLSRSITGLLAFVIAWSGWLSGSYVSANEQVRELEVEWSKEYGAGAYSANGRSIHPTSDGGYLVAGEITEKIKPDSYAIGQKAYIAKIDASGKIEWEKKLRYQNRQDSSAYHIIETRDGGYVVSGATITAFDRERSTVYLVKLDANGGVVWEGSYSKSDYNHYYGEVVVEAEDGGFLVTGYSSNSPGEAPAYLLKTDKDGNEQWFNSYRLEDNQYFNDLILTSDGGALAVGAAESYVYSERNAALIVKLNGNGEVEWSQRHQIEGSYGPRATAVTSSDKDGGYVISGYAGSSQGPDQFVIKITSSGELIWNRTFSSSNGEGFFTNIAQVSGGYTIIGRVSEGSYPKMIFKPELIHINENGDIITRIQSEGSDVISGGQGALTPDGGFIYIGQVKQGSNYLIQVTKFSSLKLPEERELTGVQFAEGQELKLKTGESKATVVQAVYSDNTTEAIAPGDIQFTSSNPSAATVNEYGEILGISEGTSEIVASYSGLQATLSVVIEGENTGGPRGRFYLDSDEYSFTVGDGFELEARFVDEQGVTHLVNEDTIFTIENPAIATIDEVGSVTGVSPGITNVKAEYKGHIYNAPIWIFRPYKPRM